MTANSNEDITGRDRLTWNVFISWAGQIVFVAFGFILPRLISDNLGQIALGVWDFAWAIVSYLNYSMLGIGSAVNRFVASHRAVNETEQLNKLVSSVVAIQLGIAIFVISVTLILYFQLPGWFSDRLGDELANAQYVVLLLGLSVAAKMSLDSYRGVITGCHRWDVHNIVNSSQYLFAATMMLYVLLSGYGLRELAQAHLFVSVGFELAGIYLAHRLYPNLEIRLSLVNFGDMKRVTLFGVNKFMIGMGQGIVTQTVNILVVSNLGPAALAVLARPLALLRHIKVFLEKFGYVITPTISSLQKLGKQTELQKFAIDMSRIGWAIGIPPMMFMMIYGRDVINIWMGPEYVAPLVVLILSTSAALSVVYSPAFAILVGLDRHGPVAKVSVPIWVTIVIIAILWAHTAEWTLSKAAILIALSQLAIQFVLVPYHVAKALGLAPARYLYRSSAAVLAVSTICFPILFGIRHWQHASIVSELITGLIAEAALLGALYWFFVIPERFKKTVRSRLRISRVV